MLGNSFHSKTLRSFCKDSRGNIAIIFAIAVIPLLAMVGASVDYGYANSKQTRFQAAMDLTALMLAQQAANDTAAQLQNNAVKYFNAVYQDADHGDIQLTASYDASTGKRVVVSGQTSVPTKFMQILGFKHLNIGASSTAAWGGRRLRVALVLDNTGSMAQSGKITALQTATKNLLNQLQSAAAVNGDVDVSIIPFVKDVNVGRGNYAASWIDWTDWDAQNQTCTQTGGGRHGGGITTCTPNSHTTWNGCVTDRGNSSGPNAGNYDTNVVAPDSTNKATLYAAEQYSACPEAAIGLSYDWPSMTTLVNNMAANGNTNQAIGLQLGWMSLVGGGPFTAPALDSNYQYSQIIILLTDGLNTQDRWYTSQASIDARQQLHL